MLTAAVCGTGKVKRMVSRNDASGQVDLNAPPPSPPWEQIDPMDAIDAVPTDFGVTFDEMDAAKNSHSHQGVSPFKSMVPEVDAKQADLHNEAEKVNVADGRIGQDAGVSSGFLNSSSAGSSSDSAAIQPSSPRVSILQRGNVLTLCASWSASLCLMFLGLDLLIEHFDLVDLKEVGAIALVQLIFLAYFAKRVFNWAGFKLHVANGKIEGLHDTYSFFPSLKAEVQIQKKVVDWSAVKSMKVVKRNNWMYGLSAESGPFLRVNLSEALLPGVKSLMIEVDGDVDQIKLSLEKIMNG